MFLLQNKQYDSVGLVAALQQQELHGRRKVGGAGHTGDPEIAPCG